MAGDQNGFSLYVAQFPDKRAHFCDTDRIEAVDRLVQDQKFGIMHHRKGDGEPLFHTERILGEQFFVFVGQRDQIQRVADRMAVRDAPQGSKDLQVFGCCKVGIKARGFDQGADPGKQLFFVSGQRLPPDHHFAGSGLCESQQHFHGGGLAGAVSAEQAVDPPFSDMDIQICNAFLSAVLFGKIFCFHNIVVHG